MKASEATVENAAVQHAGFVAELLRRRMIARLSQGDLGELMGYDRTYVNKVERGAMEPTAEFARKADEMLEACGELLRRWESFDEARRSRHASTIRRTPPSPGETATDLVVEHDEAWLTLGDGAYAVRMRKRITNVGEAAVTRFFVRLAADRHPHDARSHSSHRRPFPLDVLGLRAWCADEPMTLEVQQDRGATRELCLLFRNDQAQFPLYPGQEATIEYGYRLGAEAWGQCFQRSIRLPTRWLGVHLVFPGGLDPSVWGVEVPPAAAECPFKAPIQREATADGLHFHWSTTRPPLQARYRLEWTFRGQATR
jgi:transcriptional regulator with XRE-family HTH domain